MNRFWQLVVIVGGSLLLIGCSIKLPSSKYVLIKNKKILTNKKENLLAKRFIEYWDARIKGNTAKSWQYELPYMRYIMPYGTYKSMAKGYYGNKVILIQLEPKRNNEIIIIRKVFINPKHFVIKKDKWFYIKDNWYHKFYQAVLPPQSKEEAEFQ